MSLKFPVFLDCVRRAEGDGSGSGIVSRMSPAADGPAFARLDAMGLTDASTWNPVARWFERHVPPGPTHALRVHWLCVPIALWLSHRLTQAERRPLMIGLNAPQGAGKTTLASLLVECFRDVFARRVVALSVDDFYLTRAEQLAVAAAHPGNRFLEHRGYPGTHDVPLGERVLSALRAGQPVDLPRYDKSAHGGRGDRSSETTRLDGPVDLVVLEGWMLGFSPVATVKDRQLEAPNAALGAYEAWHRHLGALVVLEMLERTQVVAWRVDAERAMRASGRSGLSDDDITEYISRFVPAYETWGHTLAHGRWPTGDRFTLTLDARRVPVMRP
jgi:D-glycerate 3-kinase